MLPLDGAGARALLLDVEGTTTPIRFVYEVLFPYARANLRSFLERRGQEAEVRADVARLRDEQRVELAGGAAPPDWSPAREIDSAIAFVEFLMDHDRKSTGLKSLQGRIWQEGFGGGRLRGEVYPDVPPAFERWRRQGREIGIFSSGSVLAQKLLFANTAAGDLTRHIRAHFDTTTGAKREAASYGRIARALRLEPAQILFLSDVSGELDAARIAGLRTALCIREAEPPQAAGHPIVTRFDLVCP